MSFGSWRSYNASMAGRSIILCILAGFALFGCESAEPTPAGRAVLHVELSPATTEQGVRQELLAEVLDRVVDGEGYIRAGVYPEVAEQLQTFLRAGVLTGPTATPKAFTTSEEQLAYWYNARTAWSIFLAMMRRDLADPEGVEIGFAEFPLDGREMTLRQIDDCIERVGGFQAAMAAPCVNLHRAPLPNAPFRPETIDEDIRRRFVAFVHAPDRMVIDVEAQAVRFPRIIWTYRGEILADYARRYRTPGATLTTALLSWVDGQAARRLQDAIGYRCVENRRKPKPAIREDLP